MAKKITKRSRTKLSRVEELVRANGSRINPVLIQQAAETLIEAVGIYRDELSSLAVDGEVRQSHIAVAHFAMMASRAMGELEDVFNANALRLKETGSFEPGDLMVAFDLQKGRCSPRWKEEAISQARQLSELGGDETFDERHYVELVSANTPKSPDRYKPIIREAANGMKGGAR